MEIVLKGLISGIVVALVLWVSKMFGPKIGGIIAMLPSVFTLSYIFVTMEEKNIQITQPFIRGSIIGLIFFFIFFLALYFFNIKSNHYWLNIVIAYGIWFITTASWIFCFEK